MVYPDYPPDWENIRQLVLRRDKHRCRQCGSSQNLDVHHLVALKDGGSNDLPNLVTLCRECHSKIHPHMRPRPSQPLAIDRHPPSARPSPEPKPFINRRNPQEVTFYLVLAVVAIAITAYRWDDPTVSDLRTLVEVGVGLVVSGNICSWIMDVLGIWE